MDASLSSNNQDTPPGWRKVVKIRQSGKTQGRRDVYLYSPDNVKLRSKIELAKYLKDTKSIYKLKDFIFSSSSKDKKQNNKVSSENKIKEKKIAPKEKSEKRSVGKSKAASFKTQVKSTPEVSSNGLLQSFERSPVNAVTWSSDSSNESLDVSPLSKSEAHRKTNKPPLLSRNLPLKFKATRKSRAKTSVKKLPTKATVKSVKSTGSSKCQVSSLIQDISDIYAPSTSGCRARRSIKSLSTSTNSLRSDGSSPPLNVYIPNSNCRQAKIAARKVIKEQSKSRSNDSSTKSTKSLASHDVEAEEDPIPIGKNDKQAFSAPPSDESSKSSEESIETSHLNESESPKVAENPVEMSPARSDSFYGGG